MVLGALVVLLVVVLASPISRYRGSRGAVEGAATQLRDDQAQLAKLKRQQALYADPGYIQRRARTELQYAMPGDTVYVVAGSGHRNEIERTRGATGDKALAGKGWNTRLWDSVRDAGK